MTAGKDRHTLQDTNQMNTPNTQIAVPQQRVSALNIMGNRLKVDPAKLMQTLKATVFKNASDDELLALVVVSNEYGLNPLTKEIYAFPAKGGGIVPVVSIDGWVSMVNNHPAMDGMEFEERYDGNGNLESITCKLWRKDRNRPIAVTEHMAECKRNTEPWKMEHRMLRHKALMQCARYAFGFSGITDEDEAAATTGMRDVTPSPVSKIGRVKLESPKTNPYADPEPAEEPDEIPMVHETPPAPSEPKVVNDNDERNSLMADIKTALKSTDDTVATFAPKCRNAGLLPIGVQLVAAHIADLRTIAANVNDIISGQFIPLE